MNGSNNNHPSVVNYCIARLAQLGITHCFGVPGDFAFPIDDAILDHNLIWVGCTNENNAAYSADGYARATGAAMLTTTYGVGELSAMNAVMGAKAEHLLLFHLVGAPSTRLTRASRVLHHSLGHPGNSEFIPLSSACCCTHAVLTPENVVSEMERVIKEAVAARQPCYIQIPQDYAHMPIVENAIKGVPLFDMQPLHTDPRELDAAVSAILYRLKASKCPVALPAFLLNRFALETKVIRLLELLNIPFATTVLDKGTISEDHPLYVGMYRGQMSTGGALEAVHTADLIIDIGGCMYDDVSTGFGTTKLDRDKFIILSPHSVEIPFGAGEIHPHGSSFDPVWLGDILDALLVKVQAEGITFQSRNLPKPCPLACSIKSLDEELTALAVPYILERFLQQNDVLFCDTGTASLTLAGIKLPGTAKFYNQTLWGATGWSFPSAFGYALGNPSRRVISVIGDGAFQMVAQELSTMGRYKSNMIVVILDNGLYAVEEFLEKNANRENAKVYNRISEWKYVELPRIMGCENFFVSEAQTPGELEEALQKARMYDGPSVINAVLKGKLLPPMKDSMLQMAYAVEPAGLSKVVEMN